MKVRLVLFVAVCVCLVPVLFAQDAVKVDPKHYTVLSENDRVRILKVHYGPHEKSVMHSHPDTVAVFLSDAKGSSPILTGSLKASTPKRVRLATPRLPLTCPRTPATLRWT